MAKRTILFRADGGPSIGMGHFTRTLALAEMLNEHFHCIFATCQPTEYQIAEIEKICHDRIDLPEDDSHFDRFFEHLKGDEIVVLDNYYFTTEYQKAIKAKGCKLVCIDDMHDKHYVADIVINHAIGIDSSVYSIEPYTKLLLGFKYALVRKEFFKEIKTNIDKEFSCLIIMGGADPFRVTNHLVEVLAKINLPKPIAVVAPNKTNNENAVWYNNLTALEISKLMEKADFGIFPASTVAIEACAKRLPFICGYFVDNQKDIYHGIEKNNIAVCVGDLNKFQETQLSEAIKTICLKGRYEFIKKQQTEIMDNQPGKRLLKIFQEL
jgi:UDP-2,4-diacetamido-2,4,6-trideoxy-beta-L-altropyranose hydrolase